jgi:hypothetical protein
LDRPPTPYELLLNPLTPQFETLLPLIPTPLVAEAWTAVPVVPSTWSRPEVGVTVPIPTFGA